jgi:RimJ/RimL family protein N-acetyltransferase
MPRVGIFVDGKRGASRGRPTDMEPLLREVPERLETDRLIVAAPRIGDGAAVCEAALESLEELRPWMPWAHPAPTEASCEESVRRAVAAFIERRDLRLHLWRKSDGAFVGGSGLHRIDWSVPRFEIGYWVRTSFAGQGYVTEAVRAIAQAAFDLLGAARVEIHCDARNARSGRVAHRAGFAIEACLRNHARAVDGSLRDTLIFARLP